MGTNDNQNKFPVPETQLGLDEETLYYYNLIKVNSTFLRVSRHLQKKYNLNITQLLILKIVAIYPGVSISRLSQLTELPAGTVSSIINKMAQKGMITRMYSKKDARKLHLYISKKGSESITNLSKSIFAEANNR